MSFKKVLIGLIIGAVLIGLWLLIVDIKTILSFFSQIDIRWAIALPFLFALSFLVRALRWKVILDLVKPISLQKISLLYFSGGVINFLIPVRAGEIIKAVLLKKLDNMPVSKSLPTIMVEKWAEFFVLNLLLLLLCGLSRNRNLLGVVAFVLPLFIAMSTFFILVINNRVLAARLAQKLFFWLPRGNFKDRLFSFIDSFGQGMEVVKGRIGRILAILLIALLGIAVDGLYWLVAFNAFGCRLSCTTAIFGAMLRNFSSLIPAPPASIGSEEMVLIVVFSFVFGLDKNLVGAVGLFTHLMNTTLIILVGGASLSLIGFKVKDVLKERENYADKGTFEE